MPHIHNHGVFEDEVIDVLEFAKEDRAGRRGTREACGQTSAGRYLRVVYSEDPGSDRVLVITSYQLTGKHLAAYRRRH